MAPEETVDSSVLVALRECYDFDVNIKDKTDFTATGNFKSKVEYPVKCVIQLPMKFGKSMTLMYCYTCFNIILLCKIVDHLQQMPTQAKLRLTLVSEG